MKYSSKIFDVFSGAGGFSLGFEMSGCEIVAAIEQDKWAADTYTHNNPNAKMFLGNIESFSDDYLLSEIHNKSLLSIMAKVYEEVKTRFEELETDNLSHQTLPDKAIANNDSLMKFSSLKTVSAYEKFVVDIIWSEKQQTELNALQEGLQDQNPSKQIKILKAQKTLVERQYQILFDLIGKIGTSFSDKYLMQRKAQIDTKKEADSLIESLSRASTFSRTGSDKWKKMWSDAIIFAQELGDKTSDTIIINDKCVLCQQDVSVDTAKRIEVFSGYMASSAIKKSEKAHMDFQATVGFLQNAYSSINIEQTEAVLRSGGLPDQIVDFVISQYKIIISRCKWLIDYDDDTKTTIPELSEIKSLQETKDRIIYDYVSKIESLQGIIDDRDKQIERLNVLLTIKWIHDNKDIRKKDILLKIGISACKTNTLTSLKKELTQILITNTYISRFENEMHMMDHNHKIKVELVSKAEKGKAYHQVALKGSIQKKKTGEVLSEGEFRVVSLAAFLADLSSWNKILPFIFDDPITSLDHKYEKRVADRLVKLSIERQVIVFTHRLAFAQLLVSSIHAAMAA